MLIQTPQILRARRTAILAAEEDPAELHHLIANIPREHIQVHAVLGAAWRAMALVDPATLTAHLSRATLDAWCVLQILVRRWSLGVGHGVIDERDHGVAKWKGSRSGSRERD